MYRDNEELVQSRHSEHNFVLNHGALGDAICSLPAIVYGRQNRHPSVKMRVYCAKHQVPLFAHLLKPYGDFEVLDLQTFPGKAAERKRINFGPLSHNAPFYDTHTRNATHMVDFAFHFLIDKTPSNQHERSYPTEAPLGPRVIEKPYVVFPTGYTSENKAFRATLMEPLIRWALSHAYVPVLLGTKVSYTSVRENGVTIPLAIADEVAKLPASLMTDVLDLREQTTLMEARDICGHAAAVVGVDGGTIHLAGTTHVPIVYALTTAHPRHRYIARDGDLHTLTRYVGPRDLECRNCQSNWTLSYFDFRLCPYDDNACTYRLHPQDFIDALQQLGL